MWTRVRKWKREWKSFERPIVGRVAQKVNRMQRLVADRLQQWSNRLSLVEKKVALALFVLLFGGMSVLIVCRALTTKVKPTDIRVAPLSSPVGVGNRGDPPAAAGGGVSVREYQIVVFFHRYLDSLETSARGRRTRDSLLRARPGLLDSVLLIERIYLRRGKE